MNPRQPLVPFVVFFIALTPGARAVDGPLQARTWDIETTIPAGAYRSPKHIDLTGEWSPKVERGVVLDDIGFHGRANAQHWKIEGALLRKVRITGKLGVSLRAVDSFFDDCNFGKDDSWFVQWWSTSWKFDNCLFAKQFVRDGLPPLDYAARATACTFYNVKLPWIGMKDNPAGYLQKGDMGFTKCRFVQCEVPETFLAGTVESVFENCQFQGKRHDWPKGTGPIKVTAYYAGQGPVPKSFINGPLTVEFLPAPRDLQAGSSVAHSYSGGRVTLQALPVPTQFTMIGTAQKKASEIPNAAAAPPAKPLAGAPPAPLTPAPSAGGGRADFHSIDEMLRALPTGIELMKSGQLHVAGVTAANEWLAQNVTGRTAAARLMTEVLQATKEDGYAFKVTGRDQAIIVRGTTVPARLVALFRAGPAAALAGTAKGKELAVRGVVQRAILEGQGRSLALTVTLGEAQTQ